MKQFSDAVLNPNLSFRWVFDLFYGVRTSLVSIGYDCQMAIMLTVFQQNWPPENWWFDWMMVQSVFRFEVLEHPFLDSSVRTNWRIVRHSIHPLRTNCMVYFFHVKQIKPKTQKKKFINFTNYNGWIVCTEVNSAATFISCDRLQINENA